jgi:hypothetical protein
MKVERMNDSEFDLPFFTSYGWMLGLLVVTIMLLHWALVYQWPLGKTAWKRVDYIWVSFAIFGVIGGISESRQMLARGSVVWAETRLAAIWQELRNDVRIMGQPTGFCRTFNRTEASPPAEEMDRLEREYAQACTWIKDLGFALPDSATAKIDAWAIEAAPKATDAQLAIWVKRIADFAATFNEVLARRAMLLEQSKRSSGEQFMVMVAGILLVFALALRLTKVTGEIRLDQK